MTRAQDHLDVIDTTVQKTYRWINELSGDLGGVPRRDAYDVLRAFLHVLRDRLVIDEAAHLGAQLPLLVRGVYYEGWDPAQVPTKLGREEFVDRFLQEARMKHPIDPERAMRSAASTLRRHVSAGEYEEVLGSLPASLRDLLAA
jgi:uncharacterized protein (DUF2267 family)